MEVQVHEELAGDRALQGQLGAHPFLVDQKVDGLLLTQIGEPALTHNLDLVVIGEIDNNLDIDLLGRGIHQRSDLNDLTYSVAPEGHGCADAQALHGAAEEKGVLVGGGEEGAAAEDQDGGHQEHEYPQREGADGGGVGLPAHALPRVANARIAVLGEWSGRNLGSRTAMQVPVSGSRRSESLPVVKMPANGSANRVRMPRERPVTSARPLHL